MDFTLRCNSLKCRIQLSDRAVVTTCSHVFCTHCSDSLGLSHPGDNDRLCPACGTHLSNDHDAVVTYLNPTEDYKTSVLSGLSPTVIVECAGRALTFYSYQATQEVLYQEYLAKGLTEKYTNLSSHMDQIIHDANKEIATLRSKIQNAEQGQENIQKKFMALQMDYDDKCKAHRKVQVGYDKLKKGLLQTDFKVAAADEIEQSLQYAEKRYSSGRGSHSEPRLPFLHPSGQDALYDRQAHGSSGGEVGRARGEKRNYAPNHDQLFSSQVTPPSQRRTRLPVATPQASRTSNQSTTYFQPTSFPIQPLSNLNPNSLSGNNTNGYGMRSGLKVGRNQYI